MNRKRALRLVRRFEHAVSDKAFSGAAHPDTWEAIDLEYKKSLNRLLKAMTEDQDGPSLERG